jgi:hypothetical protein
MGVVRGSSEAGFGTLGRTWGGWMFAWWVRESWRVRVDSAKFLFNFHIWASASEMTGESVSMGYDRTGGWREVCRGSQSH